MIRIMLDNNDISNNDNKSVNLAKDEGCAVPKSGLRFEPRGARV